MKVLAKVLQISSPPRSVTDLPVEICVAEAWFSSLDEAREAAERWKARFLARLRSELSESNRLGRFCLRDFNSSSDYMVQGCAFIEVGVDTAQLQEAKRRRATIGDYVAAITKVSPDDFEAMCRGMLAELGVDDPVVTPHLADEGIDFYGRLKLEGR